MKNINNQVSEPIFGEFYLLSRINFHNSTHDILTAYKIERIADFGFVEWHICWKRQFYLSINMETWI